MFRMSRRNALASIGGFAAAAFAPMAFAKGTDDRKFVFVILRGGMDGLSALIPNTPEVEAVRGGLSAPPGERRAIDSQFALHPAFEALHGMASAGEAAFVHACATPYRQRSHFDGQDILETLNGANREEGWLNRALQVGRNRDGLAIGAAIPLVLRGREQVSNWSPAVFEQPGDDVMNRLEGLYAHADPALLAALKMARATEKTTASMGAAPHPGHIPYAMHLGAAGKLMAADGGPGIGVISLDGWDTHANQAPQLSQRFAALDKGLADLKAQLGDRWARTIVVAASEFGRTVAQNGTNGSDHGTGGLVILAGGAVKGGGVNSSGVRGDWPGLRKGDLYEERDLRPVNDMGAVFKGILRDHLGLDRADLDNRVFPGTGPAMANLVKV